MDLVDSSEVLAEDDVCFRQQELWSACYVLPLDSFLKESFVNNLAEFEFSVLGLHVQRLSI